MPTGTATFTHVIGIDPGVLTGLARWNGQKITDAFQTDIFEAYEWIKNWKTAEDRLLVIMEDARMNRRPHDDTSDPQAQGAGWVMILSGEFERMLAKEKIAYILKKPLPKVKADAFRAFTGIRTLEKESHIRDAVMMILNHPLTIFYHPHPKPKNR